MRGLANTKRLQIQLGLHERVERVVFVQSRHVCNQAHPLKEVHRQAEQQELFQLPPHSVYQNRVPVRPVGNAPGVLCEGQRCFASGTPAATHGHYYEVATTEAR